MKKILLLMLTVLTLKANAQWVQQTSGSINNLASVCFPSPSVGYVNDFGHLLKTTNGGTNWNTVAGVNIYNTYQLCFTSIDTGYTSGTGGILKTTNGGTTWVDNFTWTNTTAAEALYFPTHNIGYALSINYPSVDSVLIFKTTNAGASWSLVSSMGVIGSPTSIFFTSPTTGYIVVGTVGIYKTINGGATWVLKASTQAAWGATKVFFPSSTVGYATGNDSLLKSIDAGETWFTTGYINTYGLNDVFFTDNNTGYAVGGNGFSQGEVVKTIDGGVNWTLDASPVETFYSVSFPNANTGYTCGTNGAIYKLSTTIGIDEAVQNNEINIYPNPCTSQLIIDNGKLMMKEIRIVNVLGEEILKQVQNDKSVTIDMSGYAKGIYFVEVRTDDSVNSSTGSAGLPQGQIIRKKFIKQ